MVVPAAAFLAMAVAALNDLRIQLRVCAFSVNHSGEDAWTFDWIRVFFDDDSLVTCTNHSPTMVDHNAAVDVPCA